LVARATASSVYAYFSCVTAVGRVRLGEFLLVGKKERKKERLIARLVGGLEGYVYRCWVPFARCLARQKLAGLRGKSLLDSAPQEKPRKKPRKKKMPHKNSKSDSKITPRLLRRCLPGHNMIEILYSDSIKDISIVRWPCKNRRNELGGVWESHFRRECGRLRITLLVARPCIPKCSQLLMHAPGCRYVRHHVWI